MKRTHWLIGISPLLLSATLLFAQHQQSRQEVYTEISVEHTACYGMCPVYKVILRSDGTATFIGQKYTDHIGTYKADVGQFDRLSQAIRGHGFFGLKDQYTIGVTDNPHVITTVVQGGRRKTVDNYADAGPQRLWEIQALIDGVVAYAHWTKISASTVYPTRP